MSLIRVLGGNSVPATGAHAHYESESVKSGVIDAWTLRSAASITDADSGGTDYAYDETEDGAKSGGFTGSTIRYTSNTEYINCVFSRTLGYDGVTYTDQYIAYQFELMFSSGWVNDIADILIMKGFRLEDPGNVLSVPPAFDKRILECQFRYENTQADAVALPTYRTYECTNSPSTNQNPIRIDTGFDWQPNGDTAALSADRPHPVADHLASSSLPFLFRPDTWIRITTNWDVQNNELTVIMSDETSGPATVIESSTPGTGYSVSRDQNSHKPVATELILELSSSQETGTISGTNYVWWRNVIISSNAISHGNRPIGA